jgi:hypothetical protein
MYFCHSARVGASVPRPHATSPKPAALAHGQGPLSAPGGPVPGPDGGLGNNGGDRGHPFGYPRGPDPVQKGHKDQPPQQPVPAVITSHPGIVAQGGACVPSSRTTATRTSPPGGGQGGAMLRSGRIRASTPSLICSTGISWQGYGARVTSCSPCGSTPHRDSGSNPGDPIHYEFNPGNCLIRLSVRRACFGPGLALAVRPAGWRPSQRCK